MAEKKKKFKKIKLQKTKFSASERKQNFLKRSAYARLHAARRAPAASKDRPEA